MENKKEKINKAVKIIQGIDFEYLALRSNIKLVQRGMIEPTEYDETKKRYFKDRIYVIPSSFKVLRTSCGLRRMPLNSSVGKIIFYASKSERLTDKLKKYEDELIANDLKLNKLHNFLKGQIGILLGYPRCCIDFFKKNSCLQNPAINFESYKNTKKFSFYLNNLHAYPGSLISHFPCSYNCRDSIIYAKNVLEEVKKSYPSAAQPIEYFLTLPLIYFLTGKAIVFEGNINNKKLDYSFVYSYSKKDDKNQDTGYFNMLQELRKGNKLSIKNRELTIYSNDRILKKIGGNILLFDFTKGC